MRCPEQAGAQHFGSACSGFPDGSLMVSIAMAAIPPTAATAEGALIRRQAQTAQQLPWAS